MSGLDLSLYLVLDPGLCGGASGMVETARQAAGAGVTLVQLRAPNWKKRQWLQTALALKEALAPFKVPLIINDQVDVALAADADGVHIGQADLPPAVVRSLIGPDKWLGLSIASSDQLAASDVSAVDYVGIGPVYPTATKIDAAPVLGVDGFARLRHGISLPVVAIGGIQAGTCAPILAAGAQGLAVASAICGQPDVAAATARLRQEIGGTKASAH